MNYFNAQGEKLFLDSSPIGNAGAEGAVYKIINPIKYSGYCVKILHPPKRTIERRRKVEFMIKNKPSIIKDKNYKICWPEEIVYENNRTFAGFIMALAFINSNSLYVLTTPNLSKKLPPSWKKYDRSTKEGIENRYKLCVNISIAIHGIHSAKNYVIIDEPDNTNKQLVDIQTNSMDSINDPLCPSHEKIPQPCTAESPYKKQAVAFHPDKNLKCPNAASKKFKYLNDICKESRSNAGGNKTRRNAKRRKTRRK